MLYRAMIRGVLGCVLLVGCGDGSSNNRGDDGSNEVLNPEPLPMKIGNLSVVGHENPPIYDSATGEWLPRKPSLIFSFSVQNNTSTDVARCNPGSFEADNGYSATLYMTGSCWEVCPIPYSSEAICALSAGENSGIFDIEMFGDGSGFPILSGTSYTMTLDGLFEDASQWTASASITWD